MTTKYLNTLLNIKTPYDSAFSSHWYIELLGNYVNKIKIYGNEIWDPFQLRVLHKRHALTCKQTWGHARGWNIQIVLPSRKPIMDFNLPQKVIMFYRSITEFTNINVCSKTVDNMKDITLKAKSHLNPGPKQEEKQGARTGKSMADI